MKTVLLRCVIALTLLSAGWDITTPRTSPDSMNRSATWNDASREELRDTLRRLILGEVRLAKTSHDEIIDICREVYIADTCPEREWDTFVQFAERELKNAASRHLKEQEEWPAVTDCDRLDRVEAALRERGIILWQASPCCDTCTHGDLPGRIDEIERRHPGFRSRLRGYAFFIDQTMAETLAEDTHITVYLAYGWYSADDSSVDADTYERNALGIAREVCDSFREHGLAPDWDGSSSRKIGVSLHWQRRTLLQ